MCLTSRPMKTLPIWVKLGNDIHKHHARAFFERLEETNNKKIAKKLRTLFENQAEIPTFELLRLLLKKRALIAPKPVEQQLSENSELIAE